ncbi:MAG: aldose 1-epimerase [Sphingobacteriales bacterium]|nr:MAG: aldose 1-epimerase [Sphingobacteriales bacterium]
MFSVDNKQENGFDIIVLSDHSSGTSAEIIPGCGGILHAFNIHYENGSLNIIDQYSNKKQFDERVEAEGFKSCKLSPFVCRLKDGKYKFGENEYTIEKFYLGKHALHGLIYDAPFSVVKLDADEEKANAELLFSYTGTDKGFPFKYDCRVIYELAKHNTLHITTIIKNNESTAIPVADGWHPYFSFGAVVNDLYLHIQSENLLEFDEDLIPTKKILPNNQFIKMVKIGDTRLDTSFLLKPTTNNPVAILRDEEKNLQLEILPDKSYPILQVYIPDHRQSIAIENLSGAPDAFNNQLHLNIVPAGKEVIFKTSYKISNTN